MAHYSVLKGRKTKIPVVSAYKGTVPQCKCGSVDKENHGSGDEGEENQKNRRGDAPEEEEEQKWESCKAEE
jgi:hypothetical protein